MTTMDFENIKRKIETEKEKRDRAKGAVARIEEQLKTEFNVTSIEELEKMLTELNESIETNEEKKEKLMKELDSITDWNSL